MDLKDIKLALDEGYDAVDHEADECETAHDDANATLFRERATLLNSLYLALEYNPDLAQQVIEATEAESIEDAAADRAYEGGLGVSEWEALLTDAERARLEELSLKGWGTWGRERAKGLRQ